MNNRTPFRYPGAKNKVLLSLMPYINVLLEDEHCFCDAFVGGGSVALEVAERYPYLDVVLNDKDYNIYCFWSIVTGNNKTDLKDLLSLIDQEPTIDLFQFLRSVDSGDKTVCAYKSIFFNRTAFSGIYMSGPIGGVGQKSKYAINCRYNAKKIKEKILYINTLLRGRTTVLNQDINSLLDQVVCPLYLDPPYFVAGEMLYPVFMKAQEHFKMSQKLSQKTKWVLSYDDNEIIKKWYKNCKVDKINSKYCIDGVKTSWKGKEELIIRG